VGHSYSSSHWGYEAGIELNLLHRRDLPGLDVRIPIILRNAIDSIKKVYDYKYEPEIGFSVSPAVYPSERVLVYTGFAFARNTKLDYSSSSIFGGIGYAPDNVVSLAIGGAYGLSEGGGWIVSFGLNIAILRKIY
jgi:hypothetical protein